MQKDLLTAPSPVRRLVVKIGTGSLTDSAGKFDAANCQRLASELAAIAGEKQLVVVSSGAIALGAERLRLERKKGQAWDIPTKQACAAVGQPHLMASWERAFAAHGLAVAQVLLTADDLSNRKRFLNARHTFARLREHRAIAIVNENDTVAVDEIKVGDNDSLAALVATCVEADLLAILTDVEGLYDRAPHKPGAKLIHQVPRVTPEIEEMAGGAGSLRSVGGMITKVKAARQLALHGVGTVLLSSRRPGALAKYFSGEEVGTFFKPGNGRSGRKKWLALAARGKGVAWVDEGAKRALIEKGVSLLASGIRRVEGDFKVGDPIDLQIEGEKPFARGLTGYSADELKRIAGLKTGEIEGVLGYKYLDEIVHRNDLVLLDEH